MTVLIVVPVLKRPHRVAPTVASIACATQVPHRLLFVANRSDRDELAAIREAGADVLIVDGRGTYPEKVNAAYRETDEPLLFLAADDLVFHPGWLPAALAHLTDGVQVVGTNDLGNPRVLAGEHSTHTLVTRAYADDPGATITGPGTVLHEGYRHWYCDDELIGLSRARGVYGHAHDSIVEHMHPFHGKAKTDATYRRGSQRKAADQREFAKRCVAWT